jgi:fructose-1,6-bisphosphatase/inositol monophosphatase family enzyme
MAAGVLICQESGATVTDVAGKLWSTASESICVANPILQPQMLSVIGSAGTQ